MSRKALGVLAITATAPQAGVAPAPPPVDLSDDYAVKMLAVGDGPIRYWRFDGEDGAPLLCSITENEDAYTVAPVSTEESQLPTTDTAGTCVDFGGFGYATVAHEAGDDVSSGMICGWVEGTSAAIAAEHWFITKGAVADDVAGRGRVLIRFTSDGGVAAVMRDGVESFVTISSSGGSISAGTPFHVALVLTASGAQLWLDGALQASTASYTQALNNNTDPWYIARRLNTSVSLDGKLDEWAVFSGAITQEEIESIGEYEEPVDPPAGEVTGLAPPALYLPFSESEADTVEVGSMTALRDALAVAPPGRNILVQPGTYTSGTLTMGGSGDVGNPVVIRPRDGLGTVQINSPLWTITGNNIVYSKLYFDNARLNIDGASATRLRITRCRFRNNGYETVKIERGKVIRVDHCDYAEYQAVDRRRGFVKLRPAGINSGDTEDILADWNYIHDCDSTEEYNGKGVLGNENVNNNLNIEPGVWFENSLVENISLPGDQELMCFKTSGYTAYRMTMKNVNSTYMNSPRQGKATRLIECWMDGQSNFVRMFSEESQIIGCRFAGGTRALICPGSRYFDGTRNQDGSGYTACDKVQVVGNIGDEVGFIRVGDSRVDDEPTPARDTNLWENSVDGGGTAITYISGKHTGTTTNDPGISYTPAVELTPADVGLNA